MEHGVVTHNGLVESAKIFLEKNMKKKFLIDTYTIKSQHRTMSRCRQPDLISEDLKDAVECGSIPMTDYYMKEYLKVFERVIWFKYPKFYTYGCKEVPVFDILIFSQGKNAKLLKKLNQLEMDRDELSNDIYKLEETKRKITQENMEYMKSESERLQRMKDSIDKEIKHGLT